MNDEKWGSILDMVEEKFTVQTRGTEELDPEDGGGMVEFVEFESPQGLLRLERGLHAKVLGTKVHASRRIGSVAHEEKIYSDSETVDKLKAFRWDEAAECWMPFRGFPV